MYRVLKFGGSSVADATHISQVLDIVEAELPKGTVVLVASAISGATDALIGGDAGALEKLEQRHLDIVRRLFTGQERDDAAAEIRWLFEQMRQAPQEERVTFGEIFSTRIIWRKLLTDGITADWLDSRKLIIKGSWDATRGNIRSAVENPVPPESDKTFSTFFGRKSFSPRRPCDRTPQVLVAPGFICGTPEGGVSTLGRGGSDYSAAIYAASLQADSLQIWTDVPGIMTANPKQVPSARTIPEMSYKSALEMASHGAKVLYAPTVAPAMEAGIAIEVRNTFAPSGGKTVISAGAPDCLGLASTGGGNITLVGSTDLADAKKALISAGIGPKKMAVEDGNLSIAVAPELEVPALRALHRCFFETLPQKEIGLFIAGTGAVGKALLELIDRSKETVARRTGKQLKVMGLARSSAFVVDLKGVSDDAMSRVQVDCVAPSQNLAPPSRPGVAMDMSGVQVDCVAPSQNLAPPSRPGVAMDMSGNNDSPADFVTEVCRVAPRGSVFVDCTNSETLYRRYEELLRRGINIVSSNRRSFAVPFVEYASMHAAARESGAFFRYETTVGAALPVLESISRGTNSCEEVLSIEAVVSCTLNQILGSYGSDGRSFASLVRSAQDEGLTEADPRADLIGRDALRKLLILGREAGVRLEEADVNVEPIIPLTLVDVPLSSFYTALESMEPQFRAAYLDAARSGCRLLFVASLERANGTYAGAGVAGVVGGNGVAGGNGGAGGAVSAGCAVGSADNGVARGGDAYTSCIRVRKIPENHPAYHLRGTENAIIIRSSFHPLPIVIEGPGEGALQAASSILNDILR